MFRQLWSYLTLSKNQNNLIVDFLKRMIRFISPDNQEVAKRIFANYDSCRRQSLRDHERRNLLCQRYMDECLFFSIGVDMALFRNEYFISCVVRFSFDNNSVELPLFISCYLVSTWKDLVYFLFDELKEKNARFDKLVSIATDGAANMMGKYNGMTKHFQYVVERFCRERGWRCHLIHSVWCFAHRLNLVTKAFLTTKPVNVVLAFADWFSGRRLQVSYKRFFGRKSPKRSSQGHPASIGDEVAILSRHCQCHHFPEKICGVVCFN